MLYSDVIAKVAYRFILRRIIPTIPAMPVPSSNKLDGSGTLLAVTLTSSRSISPPTVRWPEKANTVLVEVAVEVKVYST